ncbi:MAG: hypothetical protein WD876_01275 [Candidatus Pacearchaeota archaeon]
MEKQLEDKVEGFKQLRYLIKAHTIAGFLVIASLFYQNLSENYDGSLNKMYNDEIGQYVQKWPAQMWNTF